ncbi:protein translocase subunit SecD [Candidatus Liberibacter sp.]|uniref:protein translocase subunit SecD n=1 Tax=Candidatus Liberibacter sp. TaxID=34022 RepID=UPI0015F4DC5B|nr:protein translocase subunit SecD [Candidatus Liberibacter sp.]MBA5723741.1 protein translocase subunit SecD [Candidatus Liberibacter sp.]
MRNNSWLVGLYAVVVFLGTVIAVPSFLPQSLVDDFPFFMSKKSVSLGLDLRGGSHLVLEVDEEDLVQERLQTVLGELRLFLKKEDVSVISARRFKDKIAIVFADSALRAIAVDRLKNFFQDVAFKSRSYRRSDFLITENAEKGITIALSQDSISNMVSSAVERSIEIIRQRIDQIGVSEPTIQRVRSNRILVQLPGEQNPARLRQLLGTTAKMSFRMVSEKVDSQMGFLPPGVSLLKDDSGHEYLVKDQVEIAGEHLNGASANFDYKTNRPIVSISFDAIGTSRFFDVTRHNVGRIFAVVLDEKVLTSPIINQAIPNGRAQISGNFTIETAGVLAAMLRAGALPAKFNIVEERIVGADLGADSIYQGLCTSLMGFALVVLFMMVLYGKWGLLANFALLLNLILTIASLTLLGATLTLPGIAGIVLGIGLAVDANVLVNERIREESRKGHSAFLSIDTGFSRAYSTIVDSNVTALIATAVLFFYGSGLVRGFAITMGLSIIISMFTAISIVRSMMIFIVRYKKIKRIDMKPLLRFSLIPDNTTIQFMKARFWGIGTSAILSICAVVLLFTHGLNCGIDFRGGIQIGVSTDQPLDLSVIRSKLEPLQVGEISLQGFDGDKNFLVRLGYQPGNSDAQSHVLGLVKKNLMEIGPFVHVQHTEIIGPKVSEELIKKGILSVIIAAIAMLIYIWIRFEWPFAVGAIATLILDITKTLGFFALTQFEFNLTAVAAILTLVGYSVNDKIVVYDCMRRNMRLHRSLPLRDLIDKSINETLGRSIYTSATAFLSMLPMAIWAGGSVSSFAVPMEFGIFIAASSSVFIAAPILLFLGDWRRRHSR